MTATTRPATPDDGPAMTMILNEIIDAGGTTAHQSRFDAARMVRHYIEPSSKISCTVAEVEGKLVGFQSLAWPDQEGQPFPDGWAIIATFVGASAAGQGAGRALFAATRRAAEAAGVTTIDATIRADNTGGLAFYSKMGFKDYDVLRAIPLRDGTPIDRIRKRLDL